MRAPFQVLVIPYKIINNEILYGIFLRSDMKVWQTISGGGEDDESPIEAAKREANEEAGIDYSANYIKLDCTCTIPVEFITGNFTWGKDVYVLNEYTFGVDVTDKNIVLSDEHDDVKWLTYDEAKKVLEWDSNKSALWELNKRLLRKLEKDL